MAADTADNKSGARRDVEARLKAIIVDQLGVSEAEILPESAFIEDLGADSLDVVELIMHIEEEFRLEIPDDRAEEIKTFKDALSYVAENARAEV